MQKTNTTCNTKQYNCAEAINKQDIVDVFLWCCQTEGLLQCYIQISVLLVNLTQTQDQ